MRKSQGVSVLGFWAAWCLVGDGEAVGNSGGSTSPGRSLCGGIYGLLVRRGRRIRVGIRWNLAVLMQCASGAGTPLYVRQEPVFERVTAAWRR